MTRSFALVQLYHVQSKVQNGRKNRKSAADIMNFNMEDPDKACVVISILNYADIT